VIHLAPEPIWLLSRREKLFPQPGIKPNSYVQHLTWTLCRPSDSGSPVWYQWYPMKLMIKDLESKFCWTCICKWFL